MRQPGNKGNKVVSTYVKSDEVKDYSEKIKKRRSLKKSLSAIDVEMKKIERALK